ncbi:hypothetical protein GUJ93_ZPchr0008g11750 [Zizania palustris]|uniref:Uncharacterized protein n=1 Tax=Zizania palustris TaxID=103762 RepID=A0A8J5RDR5_ZIZPA|nr:hypothetical protein GUJ93_ZPchr0008g11750 [Zizania palustris]
MWRRYSGWGGGSTATAWPCSPTGRWSTSCGTCKTERLVVRPWQRRSWGTVHGEGLRARAERDGRLWMADQPAARGQPPGGFFLHVECYRR